MYHAFAAALTLTSHNTEIVWLNIVIQASRHSKVHWHVEIKLASPTVYLAMYSWMKAATKEKVEVNKADSSLFWNLTRLQDTIDHGFHFIGETSPVAWRLNLMPKKWLFPLKAVWYVDSYWCIQRSDLALELMWSYEYCSYIHMHEMYTNQFCGTYQNFYTCTEQ